MNATSFWDNMPCAGGWLPTNHILFHLANMFLFLSYCTPPGKYGLFFLRIVILLASLCFAVWGWLVLCALDTFIWNFIFVLINIVLAFTAWVSMPEDVVLPEVIDHFYEKHFAKYKVAKDEFNLLYSHASEVVYLNQGASLQSNSSDSVCLVLRGVVTATRNDKVITSYHVNEFVDAFVYFGQPELENATLLVTQKDTVILIWDLAKFKKILEYDLHLKTIIEGLIAFQIHSKSCDNSPCPPDLNANNCALLQYSQAVPPHPTIEP